jgi:hypothetical protein
MNRRDSARVMAEKKPAAKIPIHPDVLAMAKRMGVKDPVKAAVNYARRNVKGGTGIGLAAYVLISQEEKRGKDRDG